MTLRRRVEGSVGQVEIASGPAFSSWTRVPANHDYPAFVEFLLNNCDSTGNLDTHFSGDGQGYHTYTASCPAITLRSTNNGCP